MANGGEVIFKFLGDDKGLNKTLEGIKNVGVGAMKALGAATVAVAGAFTALVTASVKARGEMEQLEGGAKKIFDDIDYAKIEKDAQEAYKTMNLSASEYLRMINNVGATFSQTMGDEKGYETAKKGMQAISDYASGTGADIDLLNDKYKLITRSAGSYQSICDQFAGILPQTSKDFLKQAQEAGLLSKKYKQLTDVPVAEYQQAVTAMLEKGVDKMGLLGNTAAETENTLTGSITATQKAWQNFLSGSGGLDQVVQIGGIAAQRILEMVEQIIPDLANAVTQNLPMIVQIGMELVGSIVQGVLENLPLLMSAVGNIAMTILQILEQNGPNMLEQGLALILDMINGMTSSMPNIVASITKIIMGLVGVIAEHLPEIIQAGINLIVGLALGLVQALPEIIEQVPVIIGGLVSALISAIPQLVVAAIQLGIGIGMGLVEAVPEILRACARVIIEIKNGLERGFTGVITNAKTWGHDLLEGFANGIMDRLNYLKERVMSVVNSIQQYLHFSRPDVGPLRDYETWMPDMIEGLAKSLDKASPMLLSKVHALSSEMAMSMSPSLNGNVNNSLSPLVNVVVNNNIEQDPLGQMVSQIKTFSNGAKNDYNYGYGG